MGAVGYIASVTPGQKPSSRDDIVGPNDSCTVEKPNLRRQTAIHRCRQKFTMFAYPSRCQDHFLPSINFIFAVAVAAAVFGRRVTWLRLKTPCGWPLKTYSENQPQVSRALTCGCTRPQEIAESVVSMEQCFSFHRNTDNVIWISFLGYFSALQRDGRLPCHIGEV